MQFEDGLINFKILLLKAEKVLEFLIFKFQLFRSMTVDEKIEFLKELCVVMKLLLMEMLLLVLVLYALLTLGSILKKYCE